MDDLSPDFIEIYIIPSCVYRSHIPGCILYLWYWECAGCVHVTPVQAHNYPS